eukprot:350565-Chlamydomonas_euryale.AAC.2
MSTRTNVRMKHIHETYVRAYAHIDTCAFCVAFARTHAQACNAHRLLHPLLFDPASSRHLPLGWGLPLLLRFGRLYRVRAEAQQLVLLQYMLLEAGQVTQDLLTGVRVGWEAALSGHRGSLTADEMEGLAAVMGIFLHKVCGVACARTSSPRHACMSPRALRARARAHTHARTCTHARANAAHAYMHIHTRPCMHVHSCTHTNTHTLYSLHWLF